jgi:hypothetical protein
MWQIIMAHQFIAGVVALWLFSAFVSGMPEPLQNSSRGYEWLYNSLHLFTANLNKAFAARYPTVAASVAGDEVRSAKAGD